MDSLDRDALVLLARTTGWPSISVYLPTHTIPLETNQDRIRLKNLARQACDGLSGQNMRDAEAEQFCQPLFDAVSTDEFWHDTSEGLAIFLSRDGMRVFKVDQPMPEQVVTGDRFYLRPLMSTHRTDETFYALALDKNRTRLFKGDRMSIEEVSLPAGTPITFEDAMKYDDATEPNLTSSTVHARSASRGAQRHASNFAGHGGSKDAATEQTARYARLIEHGVAEVLKNETAPLVMFGIERQVSYYRLVNTYDHLIPKQVLGASDYLSEKQVHDKALELVAPHLATVVEADLQELNEREGSPLTSHDPTEIVGAAASGRVKTLFFDDSSGPFGTLDRETFKVATLCDAQPRYLRERSDSEPTEAECGWDLVDLAAAETALHGGEVRAFTGEDSPIRGVAAVYRY